MIEGIVTSLEILVIGMGHRGSKSVMHTIIFKMYKLIHYKMNKVDYCKRATSRRFFNYI